VTLFLIVWCRRTGQNELPFLLRRIDSAPNCIQDWRHFLPFVNQIRCCFTQYQVGIQPGQSAVLIIARRIIDIGGDVRVIFGGLDFFTPLGTFDDHHSESIQHLFQLFINNPRLISLVF